MWVRVRELCFCRTYKDQLLNSTKNQNCLSRFPNVRISKRDVNDPIQISLLHRQLLRVADDGRKRTAI